jgi:hypothetical protein
LTGEVTHRRYDRYEDYLPIDKKLDNITPNPSNKYFKGEKNKKNAN